MFFITSAMFIVAAVVAITVVFIPISIILWIVALYLAARDLKKRKMTEAMTMNADILASKMAEKMQKQ
jgi:uncharacterized paraquat-inducible protein A